MLLFFDDVNFIKDAGGHWGQIHDGHSSLYSVFLLYYMMKKITGQNKLSPMSLFFHSHNVKFPHKFSCLFQKYRRYLKILTPPKLDNNILGVITQSFN